MENNYDYINSLIKQSAETRKECDEFFDGILSTVDGNFKGMSEEDFYVYDCNTCNFIVDILERTYSYLRKNKLKNKLKQVKCRILFDKFLYNVYDTANRITTYNIGLIQFLALYYNSGCFDIKEKDETHAFIDVLRSTILFDFQKDLFVTRNNEPQRSIINPVDLNPIFDRNEKLSSSFDTLNAKLDRIEDKKDGKAI